MKRSFEALIVLAAIAVAMTWNGSPTGGQASAARPPVSEHSAESLVPPDPNIRNRFSEINPGYRQRAGKSYEEHLPKASASLREVCQLGQEYDSRAQDLLQGYIYRWLDAFVEAGGTRSELTEQAEAWLDAQVVASFGEAAREPYEGWKSDDDNPLAFLFLPPPEPTETQPVGIPR